MLAPPQNQLFCEILNSINLDGLVFEHSIGLVDNLAIEKTLFRFLQNPRRNRPF